MPEPTTTIPPAPVADSPIAPLPPVCVQHGWRVSARRSTGQLRITDGTPLAKVLVRADPRGPTAAALAVSFGHAARDAAGVLVAGTAPGQWLLLGAPGSAEDLAAGSVAVSDPGLRTVVDRTHALALVALHGTPAADLLARLCPVDLHPAVTPDGAVLTSLVAGMTVGIVREDRDGVRRYLLYAERSIGRSLFGALLEAGREFAVEVDGFPPTGW